MSEQHAGTPSDAPRREAGTRTRSGNAMGRTRAALLGATADCVERYGIRKTTMVDVAARSGVAKATLYNHFRTKDDVLLALVETTVGDLVAAALASASRDGLVTALTGAAAAVAESGPLRTAAAKEPALLGPMLVPGSGRGWQALRDGVAGVLAAAQAPRSSDDVDLVLRWLLSQLLWPLAHEQATTGAQALVRGLAGSSPDVAVAVAPTLSSSTPSSSTSSAPPRSADVVGLGWPA